MEMRLKVCFKCHEFVPILENNYHNTQEIVAFEKFHSGHPVQVVNEEEVANLKRWTGKPSAGQ